MHFVCHSRPQTTSFSISAAAGPRAAEPGRQPAVLSGRAQLSRRAAGAAPTVDDVQHCAELAGARALFLISVVLVLVVVVRRVGRGIRIVRAGIGIFVNVVIIVVDVVTIVAIGSECCGRVGRGRET